MEGFDTAADFEIYGASALKTSISAALGIDEFYSNILISQVCDSAGCTAVRRIVRGRSGSSDVSVTFAVYSSADPALMTAKFKMSNFSSTVAASMSKQTNRSINISSTAAVDTKCQVGFFLDSTSACVICTTCSTYLVQCQPSANSVCATSSQITEITAGVACAAGFVLILVMMAVYRWNVLRKRAEVSRRLMDLEPLNPGKTLVVENDLPWALRIKYRAVGVLGRGAFGVVLEAVEIKHNDPDHSCAIKLIFPTGRQFTDEELKALKREVFCHHIFPLECNVSALHVILHTWDMLFSALSWTLTFASDLKHA